MIDRTSTWKKIIELAYELPVTTNEVLTYALLDFSLDVEEKADQIEQLIGSIAAVQVVMLAAIVLQPEIAAQAVLSTACVTCCQIYLINLYRETKVLACAAKDFNDTRCINGPPYTGTVEQVG